MPLQLRENPDVFAIDVPEKYFPPRSTHAFVVHHADEWLLVDTGCDCSELVLHHPGGSFDSPGWMLLNEDQQASVLAMAMAMLHALAAEGAVVRSVGADGRARYRLAVPEE